MSLLHKTWMSKAANRSDPLAVNFIAPQQTPWGPADQVMTSSDGW
jgi:hypothetical protein